jgi:hypothetical protein
MCDFRGPPYGVQNLETGEVILTGQCKNANASHYIYPDSGPQLRDVTEPGMYHVAATGSYYAYFHGKDWWSDRNDWGPPSEKYWQDTEGIPPWYNKYIFLRTAENECWRSPLHNCQGH